MISEAGGKYGCVAGRMFLSGINDISSAVVFQGPDDQGLLTNGSDLPEPSKMGLEWYQMWGKGMI